MHVWTCVRGTGRERADWKKIESQRLRIQTGVSAADQAVRQIGFVRYFCQDGFCTAGSVRRERLWRCPRNLKMKKQTQFFLYTTENKTQRAPQNTLTCSANANENEKAKPILNAAIKICYAHALLHFPNCCRRLNLSDVLRISNSVPVCRHRPPTPCKQHYYFGHRIRPRLRPLGTSVLRPPAGMSKSGWWPFLFGT